ncbi:MAG: zf-HC2 domain-containing protein [Bryobacterales bacterium]|nr:zf-HC2 domain-containing protein [Bryobacterales bacterium]
MTCEQAKERMVDRWITGLDEAERMEMDGHLAECAECREEQESLNALWNGLGDLPLEEPSRNLRTNFYQLMDAYRLGQAEQSEERVARLKMPAAVRRAGWWPGAVAAGVALVFGLTAGHMYTARNRDEQTIAQLNAEMQHMRQLVTLSLLQQQSASDRLQGVSYSVRMEPAGDEVLAALLRTLNHDQNVNVRLAAVDALRQFSNKAPVRQGLRDAMLHQDSPLVEIALINWAMDTRDYGSVEAMEKLEKEKDLHPAVKERLARALERLRMN